MNEKKYTEIGNIDFSRKFLIFEKLDGSMVAPFFLNGKLIFATRLGVSQVYFFFFNKIDSFYLFIFLLLD